MQTRGTFPELSNNTNRGPKKMAKPTKAPKPSKQPKAMGGHCASGKSW